VRKNKFALLAQLPPGRVQQNIAGAHSRLPLHSYPKRRVGYPQRTRYLRDGDRGFIAGATETQQPCELAGRFELNGDMSKTDVPVIVLRIA
jgi:hypothetical protein